MSKLFARFMKDESGATAIEYGLIAALIAVGIITAAGLLGDEIEATFTDVTTALEGRNN
ncbi:Flp family type IVb pilin [Nitratireductor basaltis]|uniref:Flp/Fap pilin component n=1 Tax=Nitratireductor basaltis TaxID=472175 RepID=A0A084UEE7_9HYPH|nr:Flp family type IVb pilin [Nitratireductor basaltis]KFB11333.1 Flp/Fap pilin component [Nitratireductor basaltis]